MQARSYGHESGTKKLYLSDKGELYIKQGLSKIWTTGVPTQPEDNNAQLKLVGKWIMKSVLSAKQLSETSYIKIHYPDSTGTMRIEFNNLYTGGTDFWEDGEGYVMPESFKVFEPDIDKFYYKWILYNVTATRNDVENRDHCYYVYCNQDGTQLEIANNKLKKVTA